jgi:hypothetical protein
MADPHESPAVTAEDSQAPPEEVDALPVLAGADAIAVDHRAEAVGLGAAGPGVQVAAVAATGFVAGAAVVGLVHRRRRRHALAPRRGASRRAARSGPLGELVQIVGTRSLLVDVHLLGGRD